MRHLDELFVAIRGQRQYLWRAVDQDAEVIDILLQSRQDVRNLFTVGRHRLRARHQRLLRSRAFTT